MTQTNQEIYLKKNSQVCEFISIFVNCIFIFSFQYFDNIRSITFFSWIVYSFVYIFIGASISQNPYRLLIGDNSYHNSNFKLTSDQFPAFFIIILLIEGVIEDLSTGQNWFSKTVSVARTNDILNWEKNAILAYVITIGTFTILNLVTIFIKGKTFFGLPDKSYKNTY